MEHSNDNVPTPDDIIREHGLDRPSGTTDEPELNPDHGNENEMPQEHQIPLENAVDDLHENEAA